MLATIFALTSLLLLINLSQSNRSMWTPSIISFFLLSLLHMFSIPQFFSLSSNLFWQDQLSAFLVLISLWITGLMIMASQKIFFSKKSPNSFLFFVIVLAMILALSFSTPSFLLFYIFFEASLIPTLMLILGWGYQPERLQASTYLIMYTVTASLPLLISILSLWTSAGHLSMVLPYWSMGGSLKLTSVWWLISIAAFLVKTPLYLTHLWLPKAHVEAPVAGSMVLAGVLLKLGSYGLIRIATNFILLNKVAMPLIMSISLIGGAFTSLICIRQTDVKSLIAYSSVSHMGLATAGIMSNSSWGWQGAMMMLIAHGLCSSCMFSLANMTYETIGSRSMYITKGMVSFFPAMTLWWFCFSAANMAAPPSLNLGAEILLITSAMSMAMVNALPLSCMAFMAAAYSLLLYTTTQHGAPSSFHSSLSLFSPRNYTICLSHFLPLIFLIAKGDLTMNWL
uniref:NADH-ubiquinone oxidoreductase chain 4 n=1 Tax=Aurospio banyulensis TaxID=3050091 RepID=A0AAU6QGR5_9ANNE